jgi:hypothetical protein
MSAYRRVALPKETPLLVIDDLNAFASFDCLFP